MSPTAMDVEPVGSYLSMIPSDKEFSRRRSADIGGLALAFGSVSLGDDGMGHGWGGWDSDGRDGAQYVLNL